MGFFFYLDIISTATMIFDIGWIADALLYGSSTNLASAA
jgi:hypothetical protein